MTRTRESSGATTAMEGTPATVKESPTHRKHSRHCGKCGKRRHCQRGCFDGAHNLETWDESTSWNLPWSEPVWKLEHTTATQRNQPLNRLIQSKHTESTFETPHSSSQSISHTTATMQMAHSTDLQSTSWSILAQTGLCVDHSTAQTSRSNRMDRQRTALQTDRS